MNNYKKNKRPVCNTIKKILIGKLFYWQSGNIFVILAVRRNPSYGYLEVLAGHYSYNKKYKTYSGSINVYSWYCFDRRNMTFVGRSPKQEIRKCLKYNPKYISYHLGKQIDLSNIQLQFKDEYTKIEAGRLQLYDNCNYYKEYLKGL